jgi:hypothetical protein
MERAAFHRVCLVAAALVTPLGQRARPYNEKDPRDIAEMKHCLDVRNAAAAAGKGPLGVIAAIANASARDEIKAAVSLSCNPDLLDLLGAP